MKLCFRWYGEKDSIPLNYIRQIPNMKSVVTAIYDTKVGEKWQASSIERLYKLCKNENLGMEVIESVPVHEDIKLGKSTRDEYIANYMYNIKILASYGVKCICYNFMPVFDWLRTSLKCQNPDGSNCLDFDEEQMERLDKNNLSLPGWDESYTPSQLKGLIAEYEKLSHQELFDNLVYFLKKIMPACNECGIDMAIHPDDPPWDIFGLPRIITNEQNLDKLFNAVPDKHNGLTFCTGSFGAGRFNNLVNMAEKYAKSGRIKFAHLRNIKFVGKTGFKETSHYSNDGSLDMYKIVKALVLGGFDSYTRPDHGRNIWGEDSKPGYGLFDRALGAAYLNGLFEAVTKSNNF